MGAHAERAAAEHYGNITWHDALATGHSAADIHRRVARERWDRVRPGVYRVVGAPRSWHGDLLGSIWSAGEHAVASHRSAARLWRLGGFDDDILELSVPNALVRRKARARVHRVLRLDAVDRTEIDTIPVTRIERTLVDLAGVVRTGVLAGAVDEALVQGLTRVERVRGCLDRLGRRGRKGAGVLALLLEERSGGQRPFESRFERRLFRLLVGAGLPAPVRQHEVRDRAGVMRIDLAYPAARLAIEADGYRWHAGRAAWERDLSRRSRLAALGWRVVHCTWRQLSREPDRVVDGVRRALPPPDV